MLDKQGQNGRYEPLAVFFLDRNAVHFARSLQAHYGLEDSDIGLRFSLIDNAEVRTPLT